MLKRFKTSGNSRENEIFACMVHNLFDENRIFSQYPDKELRITGILFGALIQEQLVSSITLGIALRYVLEALRKPPSQPGTTSSGKMFKFGVYALEQFKGRLHEWPQYCSHIVQIPHLREGYATLVAEIEREMTKGQGRPASRGPSVGTQAQQSTPATSGRTSPAESTGSSLSLPATPAPVPGTPMRKAEFGPNLGRAVTECADKDVDFEAPPDSVLDRVQFMINNMAPSNVEEKARELKRILDPSFFGWLGHFLVVKRISTQANFHGLYLSFLDCLGDYGKGLVSAILSSAYHNIGKLLRSPKITTSSSERSYLKNLGIWLGQITLARNRPILQIMLDCKELLLQGYETGKLIAVAPFLAKTLEGAKKSVIFRPPNPWLVGILGVFRAVYNVEGLKMNIKFEVEVLCKNLGIKLEDIPLRSDVLSRRIAPAKERNPDFNVKSAQPKAPTSRIAAPPDLSPSPSVAVDDSRRDQSETVIPNLAAYVTVNPNLPQLLQSQGGSALSALTTATLKRWVPIAVDKAIREIIQPVVERSVTIACITTKEIVTKDFAMEGDEAKLRKAGQLMVANLAGSLALVTCREPLRSSISQHLRRLLTENLSSGKLNDQDQNAVEQCVQICATDNLELGCMLIEKAATEKAVKDVEEGLAGVVNARRSHREQTGQPFYDMSIFQNSGQRYPTALPEQLQPKPGGLRSEHFQLYENFQRLSRQAQNLGGAVSQSASATLLPARTASTSSVGSDQDSTQSAKSASSQLNIDTLHQLAQKLDSTVVQILSLAGPRSSDVKLSIFAPDHQIRQLLGAVKKIMPNATPTGEMSRVLMPNEQELVLAFSQGIFKRLYEMNLTEPLRLEVLVALLEEINKLFPKLGRDMGTWATYAPTNNDQQRRLHRTVLLLLLRSRLLVVPDLDAFLAARTDNGRNHIWVEFSLFFIRTAFVERIAVPSDFPKLIDLMTRIADGRSNASPQVLQAYSKPIVRMLEESGTRAATEQVPPPVAPAVEIRPKPVSHQQSSSLSATYLTKLNGTAKLVAEASQTFFAKDPSNAKQQVTALMDAWIRLQSDLSSNSKGLSQFLQVLQQYGVGKNEEQTERFLRLSSLAVVDAVLKSAASQADGSVRLNHTFVDMYSRLLAILFRHMNKGGSPEQVHAQRLGVLNRILGSLIRTMMWHSEKTKSDGKTWDQRPWYRILLNLLIDLNKPDPTFEPIRLGILSVFGAAFHTCQPLVMPGFAYAWLELISHRHFMPNLLLSTGQKGWHILHNLLMDHFLFLQPYLARSELPQPIKKLYEGTLRVLLVILHDFPSFLAGYHVPFCNVIPHNCVQLKNIILSATPKGMNPPDPFTPNLKIDLLTEISRSPTLLSNVLGPIESFRVHLDTYLKDSRHGDFPSRMLPLLKKTDSNELDVAKVQSLVIYVGAHALARLQSSQISLSRTPEMEVIQKLMELDDRERYVCLNTIANQLRYPSSHTHYFSCVMLYLFSDTTNLAVKEQVTRVLLERLIVNRPHPWGLLITFIELIKNQRYAFWSFPFTRCATEIEKVFDSVARSCLQPGVQRGTLVGGDDQ
jgi:CCR4-NOT transcription complex subunit 1